MINTEYIQKMFDLEETVGLALGTMSLWDMLKRYRMFDNPEIREEQDPRVEQHLAELEGAIETFLQAVNWDFGFEYFYKTLCNTSVITALNKALIESASTEGRS